MGQWPCVVGGDARAVTFYLFVHGCDARFPVLRRAMVIKTSLFSIRFFEATARVQYNGAQLVSSFEIRKKEKKKQRKMVEIFNYEGKLC